MSSVSSIKRISGSEQGFGFFWVGLWVVDVRVQVCGLRFEGWVLGTGGGLAVGCE